MQEMALKKRKQSPEATWNYPGAKKPKQRIRKPSLLRLQEIEDDDSCDDTRWLDTRWLD